jgi:hypothetical protein
MDLKSQITKLSEVKLTGEDPTLYLSNEIRDFENSTRPALRVHEKHNYIK